jgi:hypothetical protein
VLQRSASSGVAVTTRDEAGPVIVPGGP